MSSSNVNVSVGKKLGLKEGNCVGDRVVGEYVGSSDGKTVGSLDIVGETVGGGLDGDMDIVGGCVENGFPPFKCFFQNSSSVFGG
eukprot:CAMPEP_0171298220 /NCGR_PEP_ID=MMETSP0816-20121228/6995_1 /TAXON_ID=420281 /ORGANISM="Proboscia inermis, Strain CCAP1064/1" /LENGTH=84 /DNA_ID=CAMNT_0011773101 /DNA_START=89 /DNA_END=343 /DNA_ORIENTATION=+